MIHLYPEILVNWVSGSIKNAVRLGSVSKAFQSAINSEAFFNEFLRCADPTHPFIGRKVELITFKERYFSSRKAFLYKMESFLEGQGRPLANEEGMDLLSGTQLVPLKPGAEPISLHVPESTVLPADCSMVRAVRSERYLAVNIQYDGPIFVYTSDGKSFLKRFQSGRVQQFALVDHLLFVVDACCDDLTVYSLGFEKPCLKIGLPEKSPGYYYRPFSFYKNFLVLQRPNYLRKDIWVLPMSDIKNYKVGSVLQWKKIEADTHHRFPPYDGMIAPVGDVFIEFIRKEKECELVQHVFREGKVVRESIDDQLKIEANSVCISDDRMFFLDHQEGRIQFQFYDFVTRTLSDPYPFPVPNNSFVSPYDPICTANKLYYLFPSVINPDKSDDEQLNLLTFTFGKI